MSHSSMGPPREISLAELAQHNTRSDCWICIQNTVYDVTRFLPYHPGGSRIVEHYAGRDATAAYLRNHSDFGPLEGVANCVVGPLVVGDGVPSSSNNNNTNGGNSATSSASSANPLSSTVRPIGLSGKTAPAMESVPQLQRRFSGKMSNPAGTATTGGSANPPLSSTQTASTTTAAASGPATSLAPDQIASAAQRSCLFPGLSQDELQQLSRETAGQMAQEAGVDEDTAIAEVFALLDVENRGLICREDFRNFLYRLDPAGCAEEILLRAPEQITLPVLQKLMKQL